MDKYQENPYNKKSQYTKFKEGKTTLRFFDHISGWEYWVEEAGKRSPRRTVNLMDVPEKYRPEAKSFKAFLVWNYNEDDVQICSLTQRTIIEPLTELYWDSDWGDLKEYDVTITRKGEGLETEYMVTPKPKTEFRHQLPKVDLEALYRNEDPFNIEVNINPDDLGGTLDDFLPEEA